MAKRRGLFIVLEGTDGSGKTEQFKRLVARLRKERYPVATFDFPQYGKPSSYFVREYLNGCYGNLRDIGPYKASVFYALDRFDVGAQIKKWLGESRVVVSNRYVSSNMGHQGAKIANPAARRKYFRWLTDFEYGIFGIPKPDLTLVLHVPARVAQRLVDGKGNRKYLGGAKRDLHEADLKHLKRAEHTYLEMAKIFPRDFRLVECVQNRKLLSIPQIHEKVWQIMQRQLKK